MKYLGIDIGGSSVKMGIVTNKGEVIFSKDYDVSFDNYETPILDTVLSRTDFFLNAANESIDKLAGIGISATGQIDSKKGKVIGVGGNIKNWLGTEIKEEFERKYLLETFVLNDANSAVIGEQWIGRGKNYSNIILITIGTGVGGGIIVDSGILLGNIGIAGELGHFSIDKDGKPCTCGNRGCYEQYASMTALRKEVFKNKDKLGLSDIDEGLIDGKYIFRLIEEGNHSMVDLVNSWIEDIASGLVSLIHIFNPEIILIGGGVSGQEDLFIKKLREKVLSSVMNRFGTNLELEAAALGNMAGLVGAVYYCMKQRSL